MASLAVSSGAGRQQNSKDSSGILKPIPKDKLKKRWNDEGAGGAAGAAGGSPDKVSAEKEVISNLLAESLMAKASTALQEESAQFKFIVMQREHEEQLAALQSEVRKSTQLMQDQILRMAAQLIEKDKQIEEQRQISAALEAEVEKEREEAKKMAAELAADKDQHGKLKDQTDVMREEISRLMLQLKGKQKQIDEERQARTVSEAEVEKEREALKKMTEAHESLEYHKKGLQKQLDSACAELRSLSTEREGLVADKDQQGKLKEEADKMRMDIREAEVSLRTSLAASRNMKEAKEKERDEWKRKVQDLEAEVAALQGERDKVLELQTIVSALELRLQDNGQECDVRGQRVNNLEKITEGLTRELQGSRAQIAPLADSLAVARAELDASTREGAAQKKRADAAEEALKAAKSERDALFMSLTAALKKAEEDGDEHKKREREAQELADKVQNEQKVSIKHLEDKVTKLEAEVIVREEHNSELQRTVEELRNVDVAYDKDGPGRMAQLQDENQLLQRISGLQETIARLNASSELSSIGDEDVYTSILERRSITDMDFIGGNLLEGLLSSTRSTVLHEPPPSGAGSRISPAASIISAERLGLLDTTSGLKWEQWSGDFDLSMSSYYINRKIRTAPRGRPPPPDPEPPLPSSKHPGSYVTAGLRQTSHAR